LYHLEKNSMESCEFVLTFTVFFC